MRGAAEATGPCWQGIDAITPGVPHVFQAFADLLEEGDAALNRVARFVQDNTAQKVTA